MQKKGGREAMGKPGWREKKNAKIEKTFLPF